MEKNYFVHHNQDYALFALTGTESNYFVLI